MWLIAVLAGIPIYDIGYEYFFLSPYKASYLFLLMAIYYCYLMIYCSLSTLTNLLLTLKSWESWNHWKNSSSWVTCCGTFAPPVVECFLCSGMYCKKYWLEFMLDRGMNVPLHSSSSSKLFKSRYLGTSYSHLKSKI